MSHIHRRLLDMLYAWAADAYAMAKAKDVSGLTPSVVYESEGDAAFRLYKNIGARDDINKTQLKAFVLSQVLPLLSDGKAVSSSEANFSRLNRRLRRR